MGERFNRIKKELLMLILTDRLNKITFSNQSTKVIKSIHTHRYVHSLYMHKLINPINYYKWFFLYKDNTQA